MLLQQFLFCNAYYSPAWLLTFVVILGRKYGSGAGISDPDEIRLAVTCIWLLMEPLRLWAGYSGNLKENVPVVIVFLLVTVFMAAPISVYLLVAQKDNTRLDKSINTVMLALLSGQITSGLHAVFQILRSQTQKYYLEDLLFANPLHKAHLS